MSADGLRRGLLRHVQFSRVILAPVLWGSFRARTRQERDWLYPADPAEVSIPGVDPLRTLLVGDGPAAGAGVLTHHLGMAGHLARDVAARTRRGVVVNVEAQPDASAHSTRKVLDETTLAGYDAIVLMLATTDAFCLTPRRAWQRDMSALVDVLRSASGAPVFVTSAASMHLARSLSPLGRQLTGSHARMLDAVTERVCAQSDAQVIPLNAASDLNSRTYAMWSRRIGAHIARSVSGP